MGVFGKEKKSGKDHWLTGNLDRRKKSNTGLEGGLRNIGNKAVDAIKEEIVDNGDYDEERLSPEEERRLREEYERRQLEREKKKAEKEEQRAVKQAQKNSLKADKQAQKNNLNAVKQEEAVNLKKQGKSFTAFYHLNRKLTIFGLGFLGLLGLGLLGSPRPVEISIGVLISGAVLFVLLRLYKEKKV